MVIHETIKRHNYTPNTTQLKRSENFITYSLGATAMTTTTTRSPNFFLQIGTSDDLQISVLARPIQEIFCTRLVYVKTRSIAKFQGKIPVNTGAISSQSFEFPM